MSMPKLLALKVASVKNAAKNDMGDKTRPFALRTGGLFIGPGRASSTKGLMDEPETEQIKGIMRSVFCSMKQGAGEDVHCCTCCL
jgi:hypothetical protein